MTTFDVGPISPYRAPECMAAQDAADLAGMYDPRNDEGFFDPEIALYQPTPGVLIEDIPTKELNGGQLRIGTYASERATHRVGVYVPEGYNPEAGLPVIFVQTPLFTAAKGHNQKVAEEMMQHGFAVVVKGPPRYHKVTDPALTLTEDANEMFGLMQQVQETGLLGKFEELWPYGESQGAMKHMASPALAKYYGFEIKNGLLVAPCYLREINYRRPDKQLIRLGGMITSTIAYVRAMEREEIKGLRGTLNRKDLQHHLRVISVLVSGEAGLILDHTDEDQVLNVQLFGKDGNSYPEHTKDELVTRFPNMVVNIDPRYGHVDGIKSHEVRVQRSVLLTERRYQHDVRQNAA